MSTFTELKAYFLSILPDNTARAISPQDLRDSLDAIVDNLYQAKTKTAAYTAEIDDDLIKTNSDVVLYSALTAEKPLRIKNTNIHTGWAISSGTKNPAVPRIIKPMMNDLVAAAPT